MFRCYEKSIIDQEISKMRRTKEWEETKQSILSAKELVRFLYFSLMFFYEKNIAKGTTDPRVELGFPK